MLIILGVIYAPSHQDWGNLFCKCSLPSYSVISIIFSGGSVRCPVFRPSSVGISFPPLLSLNHVRRTTFSPSSCPPNNFCVGPSCSSDHLCVKRSCSPLSSPPQSSSGRPSYPPVSCPLIVLCKAVPSSCLGHTLPPTHPSIVRYSFGTYQRGGGPLENLSHNTRPDIPQHLPSLPSFSLSLCAHSSPLILRYCLCTVCLNICGFFCSRFLQVLTVWPNVYFNQIFSIYLIEVSFIAVQSLCRFFTSTLFCVQRFVTLL